jgi:hypothetical protein
MGRAERQSSRGQWGPGLPGWGLAFRSPPTRQQVGARRPVAAPGSRDRRVLLVSSRTCYKVPVTRVLGRLHAKEDQERKRKVAPRATYPRGPWTANTAIRTVNLTVTPAPAYVARHAPRQPTPNILTKKPTEETRCTHTTQPGRTVVVGNAQRLVSGSVRPTPHGGEE